MGGGHWHGGGSTIIYGGLGWPWYYGSPYPVVQQDPIKTAQKNLENIILQIPTVWSVASINNALQVGVKDAQTRSKVEGYLNNGMFQGYPVKIVIEKQSEAQSNFVEKKTNFTGGVSIPGVVIFGIGGVSGLFLAKKYLGYESTSHLIVASIVGGVTLSVLFSLGSEGYNATRINNALNSQLGQ